MINVFPLILLIIIIITGIISCLERFNLLTSCLEIIIKFIQRYFNLNKIFDNNNNTINISRKFKSITLCTSIFPGLLFIFIMRSFIVEPFHIPSSSMMPTLLVGDLILVNKFAYGIKDPITQMLLIETNHPKRGDVVVFKYPLNLKLNYIKRVIGIPGDLVHYDFINKCITIYPNFTNNKRYIKALPVVYSKITPSIFSQTFCLDNNCNISSDFLNTLPNIKLSNKIRFMQRFESLNGEIHNILIVPGQQDHQNIYYKQRQDTTNEWIVPQGEYFMMGDNRDNSLDSRYWGFVPEKNIEGKAIIIWMSLKKQEGQWPTGIRLNHIGNIN